MVDVRFETSLGNFDVELYYSMVPAAVVRDIEVPGLNVLSTQINPSISLQVCAKLVSMMASTSIESAQIGLSKATIVLELVYFCHQTS